jgi:hypothetical protein
LRIGRPACATFSSYTILLGETQGANSPVSALSSAREAESRPKHPTKLQMSRTFSAMSWKLRFAGTAWWGWQDSNLDRIIHNGHRLDASGCGRLSQSRKMLATPARQETATFLSFSPRFLAIRFPLLCGRPARAVGGKLARSRPRGEAPERTTAIRPAVACRGSP